VVKVFTRGFGGKRLKKNIAVYTNDPNRSKIYLSISGMVEKFVTISPRRITLRGLEGQTINAAVSITPEIKYPFKITGARTRNGQNIRYRVIEREGGKSYLLTVANLRSKRGNYHDIIFLKTDSKIRPEIKVYVYGNIKAKKPVAKKKPSPSPKPIEEEKKTKTDRAVKTPSKAKGNSLRMN